MSCCSSSHHHHTPRSSPYTLDEYFASGYEESENPFITSASRKWGSYVSLIGSISGALFLLAAYITSFISFPLSSFFLVLVYFLTGTPALIHSLKNLFELNINIQVLMTLAALLSVLIGSELEGGLLLVLFALSEALEDMVTKKTKGALHTLHKLTPSLAYVVQSDGSVLPKSVKEITLNMHILVKAGEIIPLDGVVFEGNSYLNLSHLTGEGVPIPKKPGDVVPAGALNTDGTLTILVTKTSAESTLAKIIKLITEAQETKPQIQRFLDRFGQRYATSVILLFLFFGAALPFIFNISYLGVEGSIYRALAFLIAASPCALIIATPTAYLSAISACARKGILLKGGVILDRVAKCKVLAFDKTGTLTTGRLTLAKIDIDGEDIEKEKALEIAAGLERAVVHPIAAAILSYCKEKKVSTCPIIDLKVLPGFGVEGYYQNGLEKKYAIIGNAEFILQKIQNKERIALLNEKLIHEGHVTTLLLIDQTLLIFHFTDEIRSDLTQTITSLKKQIDLVMLTGDHKENAAFVAKKVAIENVYAELKPEDKLRIVTDLAKSRPLMMVGDGINDAPALANAMVGVAMGEVGSASAVEASDVVLLRDDLAQIAWLLARSKKTVTIVHQNLTLALAVIFTATICSLLGFIPLWLAVILHEGSTVTVGFNSLRLLRK
jgi:Cd2+/Zn2+-exporting ATPase